MTSVPDAAAWLRRLAVALAAMALPVAVASAAPAPDIRGIYVIADPYLVTQIANPATQAAAELLLRSSLAIDGTDGLLIELQWSDLSTGRNTYGWSALDMLVGLATTAGKKIELSVATGGFTPAWVHRDQAADKPASWARFPYNEPDWKGCAEPTTLAVPAPYDPAFLTAFGDVLLRLAAHLRADGGYTALAMVKLTGINASTYELRLPAVDPCKGDVSFTLWQKLGYSGAAVQSAWATMLGQYSVAFPDKAFNVGFIGGNAFPGIDNAGRLVPGPSIAKVSAALSLNLVEAAEQAYPGRFVLVYDSLALGDETGKDWTTFVLAAHRTGALRAYQTNYWEHVDGDGGGAACGGNGGAPVTCTGQPDFRALLFQGIYPHGQCCTPPSQRGQFLELFPDDVMAYPKATLDAHNAIFG